MKKQCTDHIIVDMGVHQYKVVCQRILGHVTDRKNYDDNYHTTTIAIKGGKFLTIEWTVE